MNYTMLSLFYAIIATYAISLLALMFCQGFYGMNKSIFNVSFIDLWSYGWLGKMSVGLCALNMVMIAVFMVLVFVLR